MTWLLVPLALLLIWREWHIGRRCRHEMIRRGWRRRACYDLLSLAALGLLLQPLAVDEKLQPTGQDMSLAVVVDVSPSMGLATPGGLSRLDLARGEIAALIDGLADARLALIPFAGEAVIQVPLTGDHETLRFFLRELRPGLVAAPGSAPEEALLLARETLVGAPGRKAILLISDGERTLPTPAPVIGRDIPIHAVLPGSRLSLAVPGKSLAGRAAMSIPDPDRLKQLARESGGRLLTAPSGGFAVSPLLEQWRTTGSPVSAGGADWTLLTCLGLLVLRSLRFPKLRRGLAPVLILVLLGGCHGDPSDQAAKDDFLRAMQTDDAATAARLFIAAGEQLSGAQREAALHNACRSLLLAKQYRQAVSGCETALFEAPGSADAARNLSLALRGLADQPPGEDGGGQKSSRKRREKGREMSVAEAREMIKSATYRPFPQQDLADESTKAVEVPLERDW